MLKLKIKRIIRNSLVLIKLYHLLRYNNRKKAIILMYHNFCREGDIKHTNVSLSITNFEKQIKYLKKYYRIVPLADLVGKIKRKEDFLPHSVAITFDDGYKNNFLLAYPLIKKYNVPVTIFLTAGYINTKKFLWVNELEYAINETQKKEISITFGCCNFKYFIKTKAEKMRVYEQLKEKLKKLENSQLRAVLDKILLRLKVKIDYDDAGNYQMLTWDEIFEMRNGYVSYGNHTFSHSILTKIDYQNLSKELNDSQKQLKEKLNQEIDVFCYPNGSFNSESKKMVKEKHKAAVTTTPGFVTQQTDLFELPRVGAKSKLSDFIWKLVRPT